MLVVGDRPAVAQRPHVVGEAPPGSVEVQIAHLGVAGSDSLTGGLGDGRLFVDQLLHDALLDAELPEHVLVNLTAVGVPVHVHLLLVGAPEARDRDVAAVDGRDHAR